MKWISCADRLPDFDVRVLVWHEGRPEIAERWSVYDEKNKCDSFMWYMEGVVCSIETIISKWMSLPEDEQECN